MSKKILNILILLVFYSGSLFAQIPDGYYDSAAGLQGESLKAALNNIISGHTELSYDDAKVILPESDKDPENPDNIIQVYTGASVQGEWSFGGEIWNREHVWAKSHGDFGNDPPAGSDLHHLKPALPGANTSRSNKDFEMGGEPNSYAPECNSTSTTWEPRDPVKGDIARMMFYMAVRYEGDSGDPDLELVDYVTGDIDDPIFGVLSTLIEWNEQDPVDDFERNRNDVIYSYQGNRNPFIDHPEYVNAIYNPTAIKENELAKVSIFPNPAKEMFYLLNNSKVESISILNILGKEIKTFAGNTKSFDVSDLPKGQYIVLLKGKFGSTAKPLVVIH